MRETRLLMLVVVVSVAVLLLLARFRFPETSLANVAPSAGPLAGLAARATFDEMAAAMSRVLTQVAPTVALVRFDPHATPAAENGRAQAKAESVPPPGPSLVFPGIRIQSDVALVYLPPGHHPVSTPDLTDPVQVIVSDPTRQLALVRTVPSPLALDGLPAPVRNLGGLSYVANVRALSGSTVHTVQPVFIGRTVSLLNEMLGLPSAAVGADSGLSTGSLVFTLDGRFIGIVVPMPPDEMAIVSGEALVELARRWLAAGSPVP